MRQQNSGAVEDFVYRILSTNPKVKELLKSVHIFQSYRKNKWHVFMAQGVVSKATKRHCAGTVQPQGGRV